MPGGGELMTQQPYDMPLPLPLRPPAPKTNWITFGAAGVVIAAVLVGGGAHLMLGPSSPAGSSSATHGARSSASQSPAASAKPQAAGVPAVASTPAPLPAAAGAPADNGQPSDSSHTTVTVNGQTTELDGNGSVDKSYTSDDGTTHVTISIHSHSTVSGGTRTDRADDMDGAE